MTAIEIGSQLVAQRMVACANYFPIGSAYWWQGEIENANEWVALMKTTAQCIKCVEDFVHSVHPYEVPCIVHWEVNANKAYEEWVTAEVTA